MSEPDTAAIIFDNVALPNKSLTEQLEAKNHQTVLNYLFGYIAKKGEINEALILKLHNILMNGILPDAGLYRRHGVRIAGVNLATANYLKISEFMSKLISKAGKKPRTLLVCLLLFIVNLKKFTHFPMAMDESAVY